MCHFNPLPNRITELQNYRITSYVQITHRHVDGYTSPVIVGLRIVMSHVIMLALVLMNNERMILILMANLVI